MHTCELYGEDVIALPGQNLTETERRVLIGLADGHSPSALAAALNLGASGLRHTEASIRAKLGATTHTHMIARAFVLGVLIPRALCLMLAAINALDGTHDALRTRTTRRTRTAPSSSLVVRSSPATSSGRNAPLYAGIIGQHLAAAVA